MTFMIYGLLLTHTHTHTEPDVTIYSALSSFHAIYLKVTGGGTQRFAELVTLHVETVC